MSKNKIVIANWKMKLTLAESKKLAQDVKEKFTNFSEDEVVICPNFLSICEVNNIIQGSTIGLGAQDVFWEELGAYSGEVSASMLKEAGCKYVIIGHSERRKFLMENYEMIHKELKAVLAVENMVPIVCIGENWDERKTDRRDYVLFEQLQQALTGIEVKDNQEIIVAYEPIWAIGSGTAIEPAEADYAHKIIRLTLNDMFGEDVVENNFKIIYGGSINKDNVVGFNGLDNIDGLLVGVASLNPDEFLHVANKILKK
ncbi:triose-phosphate isomerase [Candidatus Parcubacteria bacterium]|nr:MAG: triose-phosphate isomerase [Candidatus Parcubacteria bacterium]